MALDITPEQREAALAAGIHLKDGAGRPPRLDELPDLPEAWTASLGVAGPVEAENMLLCREAASRLSAALAEVEDTVYADDIELLISIMPHAEPGSMVADAARALLGIPLAAPPAPAPIVSDTVEAAAAKAWEARWQGLTPEQRKAELAAMDAYASDPQSRI